MAELQEGLVDASTATRRRLDEYLAARPEVAADPDVGRTLAELQELVSSRAVR